MPSIEIDIKGIGRRVRAAARTTRGRNLLTFGIFLALSFLFWLLNVLNDDVKRDYDLPVAITGVPADVHFISNVPSSINVVVQGKGTQLLRYEFGSKPMIYLDYKDFDFNADNRMTIHSQMVNNSVRDIFRSGNILSVRPDSISLVYTTHPGERLPIKIDVDAHVMPQYAFDGPLRLSIDSVEVYTLHGLPTDIQYIATEHVSVRNLTDSTTITVDLVAPAGSRVEPSSVNVTIPVSPLIKRTRRVPVEIINVPDDVTFMLSVSMVDLTYLVPMSLYNSDTYIPTAYVDYNDIADESDLVPIHLTNPNEKMIRGLECSPSVVEYDARKYISVVIAQIDEESEDDSESSEESEGSVDSEFAESAEI